MTCHRIVMQDAYSRLCFYFYVFVHGENKLKQSALFIALLPLLFTPAIYADTHQTRVLDNRAAKGDITHAWRRAPIVGRSNRRYSCFA